MSHLFKLYPHRAFLIISFIFAVPKVEGADRRLQNRVNHVQDRGLILGREVGLVRPAYHHLVLLLQGLDLLLFLGDMDLLVF